MRVCLELRHDLHPGEWSLRHRDGEVPDRWPYGLDRLTNYGLRAEYRTPLRGRVGMRAARAMRAKGGGFEWLECSAAAVSAERRRADVVLCWDEYVGVPAAIRERTLRGVPVVTGVIWLADTDPRNAIATKVARLALQRAALVWVLSSGMIPVLRDVWGVPPQRLHLVPMGVDADFFKPAADPPEHGLVASAGNDRDRDHDLLVRAMSQVRRRHPQARLELASRLPVRLPSEIGRRHTALGHPQIATMYRRAEVVTVLTRPNLHASGLTVTLEAMATARPVVATDTPGMSDYVSDGETGLLVPPGDLAAAARAIESLLGDPQRARAMGLEGRRAIEHAFTSEKQACRLAELLRELA